MGKTKSILLQIPSSCHENWNDMTPKARGRHCSSCQKTVVDFTQMSDTDIFRYFEKLSGPVCGRLLTGQLNRVIDAPQKTNPFLRYLLPASIPALLLSSEARTQPPSVEPSIEAAPVAPNGDSLPKAKTRLILKGHILEANNTPIPGASIFIKNTSIGTATDASGYFTLQVSQLPVTLIVTSVGFVTTEVNVKSQDQIVRLNVSLRETVMGDLGVIVYTKPKKYKPKKAEKRKPDTLATQQKAGSLILYPNPVTPDGTLHLRTENMEPGDYTIELFSFLGVLTQSTKVNLKVPNGELSMALNRPLPGSYLLRMTHKKTRQPVTQQVMISH